MAEGFDVNGLKGAIDFHAAKQAGMSFAYIKATEGVSFNDERFQASRKAAREAGFPVGAYHFARPDLNSAADEAAHFVAVVGKLEPGELRPALDFEHSPPSSAWALDFMARVKKGLGVTPVFYTYPSFLGSMSNHGALDNYPLWFASYGPNDGKRHSVVVPAGFKLVIHQYTSNGSVTGLPKPLDRNFAPALGPILAYKWVQIWGLRKDGKPIVKRDTLKALAAWVVRHPGQARGSRIYRPRKQVLAG